MRKPSITSVTAHFAAWLGLYFCHSASVAESKLGVATDFPGGSAEVIEIDEDSVVIIKHADDLVAVIEKNQGIDVPFVRIEDAEHGKGFGPTVYLIVK